MSAPSNPNPNKMLWEKGDFTRVADGIRKSAKAFVQTLGVTKGMKILDLACGDGNTALPEAELAPRCWASISHPIWSRLPSSAPKNMD